MKVLAGSHSPQMFQGTAFLDSPSSWWLPAIFGVLWLWQCHLISASVFTQRSSLTVGVSKFPSPSKDARHWVRAHLNPGSPLLNLTTSAKTFFLNKATFIDTGGQGLNKSFLGDTIQPIAIRIQSNVLKFSFMAFRFLHHSFRKTFSSHDYENNYSTFSRK